MLATGNQASVSQQSLHAYVGPMLLKCRTLFTSSTSDLKRKAVTSRIPVEVCQVDIVYHRLMEHWQAHLLA